MQQDQVSRDDRDENDPFHEAQCISQRGKDWPELPSGWTDALP
jgi:hypothetical protein